MDGAGSSIIIGQETASFSILLDFNEPVGTIVKNLRESYNVHVKEPEIYLQNIEYVNRNTKLSEICIEKEGKGQIQVEISTGANGNTKINILDVVRPVDGIVSEEEIKTRWVEDPLFKAEQERLKMPDDPCEWTREHVQFWLNWAVKRFSLKQINPAMWKNIDGVSLCTMTHTIFKKLVKVDENDNFWTHMKLLKECKFVGVLHKSGQQKKRPVGSATVRPRIEGGLSQYDTIDGYRKGSSQVQLWQFLLDLLTSWEHRWAITWVPDKGCEGEFILLDPERVAELWGSKKNKPNMNYEKLSRALRYYYEGDMITKVPNKRFVYKFVCDLKQLLGFSAQDLDKMLAQCERKAFVRYGIQRPLDENIG
ncbi:DNA-binding protein Ets97D-like isoform X2 [Artemia franciscana]|uniref:GA-binding protein alpha chain n=2 Tax=Artemia franciscana TaxID=6661 RepID=A0AA88HHX7_ARTSF|nr:hypothetical protein QYM36_013105 [Artemia franciscana]KAK2709324.1 hypothetical protein QYM36_013105 [Artemia franciscana]